VETNIILTGIGATAITDLWALVRRQLLGTALPDYGLVGRWIAHFRSGRFRHASIKAAAAVRGERMLGWFAHYLIGIAFAALLLLIGGARWFEHPSLWVAVAVGVGTVLAPFLIMQPGMGAGIAASRTPRPAAARVQSLITHAVFGVGLYLAAAAIPLLSGYTRGLL
jgi:Protein of unknown function (DUF2938)